MVLAIAVTVWCACATFTLTGNGLALSTQLAAVQEIEKFVKDDVYVSNNLVTEW